MAETTIAAPATPPGEGGIAILRISGPEAVPILAKVFSGPTAVEEMAPRRLYLGHLVDRQQRPVDQILAVVMPGPHSYTGEDLVELHCHGGHLLRKKGLDLLIDAGARLASPGEFTRRAFVNGRLDLAQAEAVADLIRSRSEQAGRHALLQLDGRLSQEIKRLRAALLESLTLLEAHIDFSDEEVGPLDPGVLARQAVRIHDEMVGLIATFDHGRVLKEGLEMLILGRPNVGKSSLMNALVGSARAIVTEIAGTTRDTLEEQILLGGIPVRLVDTAGVRESSEPIEREGVRRARAKVETADLILLVVDGSQPLTAEDQLAADLCDPERTLVVVNKCDLPEKASLEALERFALPVKVSARSADGLDRLVAAVVARFSTGEGGADVSEEIIITERRHREALVRSAAALARFAEVVYGNDVPAECRALELREALDALGEITGETAPDEILEKIFSSFCIGK